METHEIEEVLVNLFLRTLIGRKEKSFDKKFFQLTVFPKIRKVYTQYNNFIKSKHFVPSRAFFIK
jgi:hypothetical protein